MLHEHCQPRWYCSRVCARGTKGCIVTDALTAKQNRALENALNLCQRKLTPKRARRIRYWTRFV